MNINIINNKTYRTHEVAKIIGVHPNTVRMYEDIGFIEKPMRENNGYRIFTQIHIDQMKIARLALKGEILQHGLRKRAVNIIRLTAKGDYDNAIKETNKYIGMLNNEINNAIEAISIVEMSISNSTDLDIVTTYKRKQVANLLGITVDTLRNWELNGLITVKRAENGYRVYNNCDIKRLKIIRTLRCASYSLSSILRLLNTMERNEDINITKVLNTPQANEDIISVCDKLQDSLTNTKNDAEIMLNKLFEIKK